MDLDNPKGKRFDVMPILAVKNDLAKEKTVFTDGHFWALM